MEEEKVLYARARHNSASMVVMASTCFHILLRVVCYICFEWPVLRFCSFIFEMPFLAGRKPCTEQQPKITNKISNKRKKKKRLNKKTQFIFILQVHHDMTPDELRRVFHVDSHDQGRTLI